MKDRRLNSGSDSRPIIGSDFGANITSQYRPAIIIQASIDHRSNIDSQHSLPTLRAWADHRPDHIFLPGQSRTSRASTLPISRKVEPAGHNYKVPLRASKFLILNSGMKFIVNNRELSNRHISGDFP